MSLDAAHMKTTGGGGTLYIASVTSACNDIFPVAIALMVENENKDGWLWFLNNLKSGIPVLDEDHPKEGVAYKLFTFMSDRQKGLIEAVKEVFPLNHHCFCAVHIARNVETKFGLPKARFIVPLAKTFSSTYAEELLRAMGRHVAEYVQGIEDPQWRSRAWLNDESLPPRYGIVTSNVAESANSMFEQARDVPWKSCVHMILSKMVERIADLSEKYSEKHGVVPDVVDALKVGWADCAGMKVVGINEGGDTYTVFEPARGAFAVETTGYNMNVIMRACDCGMWQEHQFPCVHAIAFFKKIQNYSFEQLLLEVCKEYTFEHDRQLFKRNFLTVCMDKVEADKTILAPVFKKRKAGRPRKKRMKKRSRFTSNVAAVGLAPSKTPRCRRCGLAGHNARTCIARQLEMEELKRVPEGEDSGKTFL